ncbi:hypothetical protein BC938DRAFT_472594 [Jimgerdemannia flammicorona]|uniref:Uncharacterized protein n=1 Tax=Jimgerdemannia flammicorona TaxID=994334 RepID=A0A433Q5S4_9FUNG|nr:hypothetical protein BC938DRAFT_472594 [Jimgerdemannia flammicorona]
MNPATSVNPVAFANLATPANPVAFANLATPANTATSANLGLPRCHSANSEIEVSGILSIHYLTPLYILDVYSAASTVSAASAAIGRVTILPDE